MPSYKSSHLNLYSTDGTKKLDIDVLNDKATITHENPIEFSSLLNIGTHVDVGTTLTDIKNDIINNFANSTSASNLVQNNLTNYISSNDASVGTLSANLASETATRTAALATEALNRATAISTAKTTLQSNIDTEEAARIASDNTLTSNLNTEITDRTNAISAETATRSAAVSTLTSAVNVEKARIDAILSGAGTDLNTLKEVIETYKDADNNLIKILVGLQSQVSTIFGVIDSLTEGTNTPVSTALEAVIAGLVIVNNKAWLTSGFDITYDMLDQYNFSTNAYIGWTAYKAALVAASGGALTGSSTDEEVKAWLHTVLVAQYGTNYEGTVDDAKLKYLDYDHYLLSINLPSGSKPYFMGSAVSSAADVSWRLDYTTVSGDDTTIYSSILSGTSNGNSLTVVPASVETPVSGSGGVRVGFKSSVDTLTINV